MVKCPAGHKPMKNKRSKNSYYAIFHVNVCNKCPFKDICSSQKYGKNNRQFQYDEIKLRLTEEKKKSEHVWGKYNLYYALFELNNF